MNAVFRRFRASSVLDYWIFIVLERLVFAIGCFLLLFLLYLVSKEKQGVQKHYVLCELN